MAFDRKDLIGRHMDLGDVRTMKVVDITMDCKRKKDLRRKVLLQFAKSEKGILVQLVNCYLGEDFGSRCNFVLNSDQFGIRNETFVYCARIFGLAPEHLWHMIHEHAPEVPVVA